MESPTEQLDHILQTTHICNNIHQCLREELFPAQWKVQNLVFLPKPGKPPGEPSSYRPICQIDFMGKVLKQVICTRLEKAIEIAAGLSPKQFGFRRY